MSIIDMVNSVPQLLRELPVYTANPFIQGVELKPRRKKEIIYDGKQAIINLDTGQLTDDSIAIARSREVDSDQYVMLYTKHINTFFELGKPAQRVCQFVMYMISSEAINRDEVKLLAPAYVRYYDGMPGGSLRTMQRGLSELASKNLIARTEIPQIWYINPAIVFNGDRARFITEIRRKPEAKKVNANQRSLPFDEPDA